MTDPVITQNGPLYPVYQVLANGDPVGESEMMGNRTPSQQGRKQRWHKILNPKLEDAAMLVMSA